MQNNERDPERPPTTLALTHFAGRVGDHNDRAMSASPILAAALGERLGLNPTVVGSATPSDPSAWDTELDVARPALERVAAHYGGLLADGRKPVAAISRCSVALATLPVVAAHRPDAVVVWFDAHADLHTPASTESGYLGGMALSGPLGLWDSGLGAGLSTANTILVGARDIEPFEHELIAEHDIDVVGIEHGMAAHLQHALAGRPAYVHIDCDVLEPGTVPTDYRVAAGMTLAQLTACAHAIARSEVVGLEIGELETDDAPSSDSRRDAQSIVRALEPLMLAMERSTARVPLGGGPGTAGGAERR